MGLANRGWLALAALALAALLYVLFLATSSPEPGLAEHPRTADDVVAEPTGPKSLAPDATALGSAGGDEDEGTAAPLPETTRQLALSGRLQMARTSSVRMVEPDGYRRCVVVYQVDDGDVRTTTANHDGSFTCWGEPGEQVRYSASRDPGLAGFMHPSFPQVAFGTTDVLIELP